MKVLVVNAGSSSLKYQLFDTVTGEVPAKGICERIGIDGKIDHKCADGRRWTEEISMPNHSVATKIVVDALTGKEYGCLASMDEIEAIGHRVVHGGPYFFESCLLTDEVLEKLELCRDLAPLHTPAAIMGIEGCKAVMPTVRWFSYSTRHYTRQCLQKLIHMPFPMKCAKNTIFAATASTVRATSSFPAKWQSSLTSP
ncbi:MAG: hypothetical protein J6C89_06700 [Clostridia bacterium]|nr:hypothetical protein [Clostridia bacterium]